MNETNNVSPSLDTAPSPSPKRKGKIIIFTIIFILALICAGIYVFSRTENGEDKDSLACEYGETAKDKDDQQKMATLFSEIKNSQATSAEDTDELIKEYTAMEKDLAVRQFERIPQGVVDDIYTTYCVSEDGTANEGALRWPSDAWAQKSLSDLACNLENDRYFDSELPFALSNIGFKLQQAGRFDQGFKFYECAAERHLEPLSMYRIIQIYTEGSASVKKQFPDLVIENHIEPDYRKAYFWSVVFLQAMKDSDLSSKYNYEAFVWRMVSTYDYLVANMTNLEYAADEVKGIASEAETFVQNWRR